MVFPSINPHTRLPVVSVLNMLSDTRCLYNSINNVKLRANGHTYSTGPVETLQIMNYRHLTKDGQWLFDETAEVIFTMSSIEENLDSFRDKVAELTITLNSQTQIQFEEGESNVRISGCDCVCKTADDQERLVNGIDLGIELPEPNDKSADPIHDVCYPKQRPATYLHGQLQYLQQALRLYKIQHVQRDEKTMFGLYLGTASIYHYQIADGTLTLCASLKGKNYRLLISNPPKTICLSIEVSSEYLQ
ncbi:hypothetical protein BDV19DRAFT_353581 [Aspergillus venezuelensis]